MPSPTDAPRLVVTEADGRTTARIVGCSDLTDTTIEPVGRQLTDLVKGRDGMDLVLDLIGIDFLTSAALMKFVGLHRTLKAARGRLAIVNVHPRLHEVFTVARLDKVLDVRVAE